MTRRLLAVLLGGLVLGAAGDLVLADKPAPCAPQGWLDQGTIRGDEGPVVCTVADETSPIAR